MPWLAWAYGPQAAPLLQKAKAKYESKDLLGAMKLFEDVLALVSWLGAACGATHR